MAFPVGAAIAGAASAFGSLLSAKSASDSRQFQEEQAARNEAMQREFAQQGVRWRVEDAKAAGIHPLFALGFQGQIPSGSSVFGGESRAGEILAQGGQDIGRAIDSTRTNDERVTARLGALSVERAELENAMLRSQIARLNQQSGPPMPAMTPNLEVTGGNAPVFESAPLSVTIPHRTMPHSEPVALPDVGWVKTPSGGVVPVPSKDAKERIEDQVVPEAMWALRNLLIQNLPFARGNAPPRDLLPSGADHWEWSRLKQEWVPMYRRSPSGEREYRYELPPLY